MRSIDAATARRNGDQNGSVSALEGVFGGVSSGAVLAVARRLAAELDEGVVVGVLADGGWKYLSADFWDADDEDVDASMERTVWW